jgi:hypothetical protein
VDYTLAPNHISPTAPKRGSFLYDYLTERSKHHVGRLEAVGQDYDRVLVQYGRDSHQEAARYHQYRGLLDEYMRCEDVLRGIRTPSSEDYDRANEREAQSLHTHSQRPPRRR